MPLLICPIRVPGFFGRLIFGLALIALPVLGQTWESLQLSGHASGEDVSRYLSSVRKTLRKTPVVTNSGQPMFATESKLDRATAERLQQALGRVPVSHIGILLDECTKAEKQADKEASDENKSVRMYGGFVERRYRTPFTLIAIGAIDRMADIPLDQQVAILSRLAQFPELVLVASSRSWETAIEPQLSVRLMDDIERKVGWGAVKPTWIEYLIRLDSPNSRQALLFLLTRAYGDTREETYWAITKAAKPPKIDLVAAVTESWRQQKKAKGGESYARVAAHAGVLDGLLYMADEIRGSDARASVRLFGRTLIDLLVEPFDDIGKAADYVRANRKNIIFDEAVRKYRTKM